jgi:hypothetical protein
VVRKERRVFMALGGGFGQLSEISNQ